MTNAEPLRFGPPRDRRRGKRILTLNNFLMALLVGVLVFAAISIASEMRGDRPGDYGRLYSARTLPSEAPAPKPVVVQEQEIPDQTATDPMLVHSGSREEYLGVIRPVTPPTQVAIDDSAASAGSTSFAAPATPVVDQVNHSERLVLSGGPEGLRLDVRKVR